MIPLASSLRTRARTVGRAVGWWDTLGASTVVAGPDPAATHRLIDCADVSCCPGGVSDRLHQRLVVSDLGPHLAARWRAGTHLSGSSSGAMVAGSDRQTVRPIGHIGLRSCGVVPVAPRPTAVPHLSVEASGA